MITTSKKRLNKVPQCTLMRIANLSPKSVLDVYVDKILQTVIQPLEFNILEMYTFPWNRLIGKTLTLKFDPPEEKFGYIIDCLDMEDEKMFRLNEVLSAPPGSEQQRDALNKFEEFKMRNKKHDRKKVDNKRRSKKNMA